MYTDSTPDVETGFPNIPSMREGSGWVPGTWVTGAPPHTKIQKEAAMNDVRKYGLGLAALAVFVSFGTLAMAQQQPQPLKVTKIKDNVYWVQGGAGSNDGVIVGNTGVIVVDAKTTTDSEKEVIAEIAKITPKAEDTAIVTHSDGDHVNGLRRFPGGVNHHRAGKLQKGNGSICGQPKPGAPRSLTNEDLRQNG